MNHKGVTIQITEIYGSIQGESLRAGLPTTFVRTTGCPVRCVYCDTAYAFAGGTAKSIDEILEEVRKLGHRHVCVTGGEPLAQRATFALIQALIDDGRAVSLETSGVRPIEQTPRPCKIVLDIKLPDSGVHDAWLPDCVNHLQSGDEIKAVITSERDWSWYADWYARFAQDLQRNGVSLSVSAVQPGIDYAELAAWILRDGLEVRLNVQLHKLIWPGRDCGV